MNDIPLEEAGSRDGSEEGPMDARSETYWIHVVPKKHTGETIALLVTIAVLFALLILWLGHPKPPLHPHLSVPTHAGQH